MRLPLHERLPDKNGPVNVRKIRHIHLEVDVNSSFITSHDMAMADSDFNFPGRVLADILSFLALNHRLKTLEISRKWYDESTSAFQRLEVVDWSHHFPEYFEIFCREPYWRHSWVGDALREIKRVKLICKELDIWAVQCQELEKSGDQAHTKNLKYKRISGMWFPDCCEAHAAIRGYH